MPKTRRLGDLYVVGQELTLDDGEGAVTVWINKLNPVDQEAALRNANAARARVLAGKRDPDNQERLSLESELLDQSKDELVDFLAADALNNKQEALEAELAAEQEWDDKNYLQGLLDAWEGGMEDRYNRDPEDAEAKHVFEEMDRWHKVVQERLDGEKERLQADIGQRTEDILRQQVLERLLTVQADLAWLSEYHLSEILFAVREPDHHKKKYFNGRADVEELPQEVMMALYEGYRNLSIDPTEGKDSPGTPASSPSSEPSTEEETSQPSGPQDALL
jgi:hypothetical protein